MVKMVFSKDLSLAQVSSISWMNFNSIVEMKIIS